MAKFLCDPHIVQSLPTEEIAKRAAFVISWVAEDIDSTVGGLPDVIILKDRNPSAQILPEEVLKEQEEHARRIKRELPKMFFQS